MMLHGVRDEITMGLSSRDFEVVRELLGRHVRDRSLNPGRELYYQGIRFVRLSLAEEARLFEKRDA
jgi:hypothetical protein